MEPRLLADFLAFSATADWPQKVEDINKLYQKYSDTANLSKYGAVTARMVTVLKRELKDTLEEPGNRVVCATDPVLYMLCTSCSPADEYIM